MTRVPSRVVLASKLALIYDGHAISNCIQRPLNALVWRNSAQVFVGTERGEMALLVALTQSLKNLLKHARLRLPVRVARASRRGAHTV